MTEAIKPPIPTLHILCYSPVPDCMSQSGGVSWCLYIGVGHFFEQTLIKWNVINLKKW